MSSTITLLGKEVTIDADRIDFIYAIQIDIFSLSDLLPLSLHIVYV
ncbi:MAG: hypothetical protein V3S42_01070 [Candidatus Neomarinimicrobiota bacterium]